MKFNDLAPSQISNTSDHGEPKDKILPYVGLLPPLDEALLSSGSSFDVDHEMLPELRDISQDTCNG